jgi:transcription antitermination protein NusB
VTGGRGASRGDEGPRHEARERALGLLYEAELKSTSPNDVLASLAVAPDPYAVVLVQGVAQERERLDSLVAEAAVAWEIERMPVLDRSILRMATYELIANQAVPVAVVIDEAVELAKQYSTEDSGRFVNGVLSQIARQVRA